MKKLTQIDFIKKSIQLHGQKYNYDKVNYINNNSKVIITCPEHGDFEQLPRHHLSGQRCGKCHGKSLSSINYFVKKAIKVHGNKYDYNKVNYKHNKDKITIICNKHGEFVQSPVNHLRGYGCSKCADIIRQNNLKKSNLEQFIQKANLVHKNKYEYSKVEYKHSEVKICIVCPDHGEFWQKPDIHLCGSGCPICNTSKGELAIKEILEKNDIKYIQEYRIPEIVNKLYYDFFLPDFNVLIEFHGKQHYEFIPYFHRNGEDDFLKQKNRDDIIRYNAKHYKYRYLEFNYKQLKKLSTEEFEAFVIALIKRK